MNPWFEYYLYAFGPFVFVACVIVFLNRRMMSKSWVRLDKISKSSDEALEIHRQSLAKLHEIKTLLEERKA
jgi:hypothetical protein